MPNQYKGKPVDQTCEHPDCNNIFQVWPYQLRQNRGRYCSKKCWATMYRKYDPKFIKEYWPFHTIQDFADHFGVTLSVMSRSICHLRAAGYNLPFADHTPKYKIGDTKMRKDRGMVVLTIDGWRSVPREKTPAAPKQRPVKTAKKVTAAVRRQAKVIEMPKERRPAPVKNIPVVINTKTTIWVSSPEQIPVIREKYKHLNENIYAVK